MKNDLKELSNPGHYHDPIAIGNYNLDGLRVMLKLMLLIRKTEHQLALGRKNGLIGGPVHLGAGQEAIAVGISQNLKNNVLVDYITNIRSKAQYGHKLIMN